MPLAGNVAGLIGLASLAVASFAETSIAASVEKRLTNASSAIAYFRKQEECIIISASASVYENIVNRQETSSLLYSVYVFDDCNFTTLLAIAGEVNLDNTNFAVGGGTKSATLVAAVDAIDQVSGAPVNLEMKLVWSSTDQENSSVVHNRLEYPNMRITETSKGLNRAATAIGTVSDGQTNYTPDPSEYAQIGASRSGIVTFTTTR